MDWRPISSGWSYWPRSSLEAGGSSNPRKSWLLADRWGDQRTVIAIALMLYSPVPLFWMVPLFRMTSCCCRLLVAVDYLLQSTTCCSRHCYSRLLVAIDYLQSTTCCRRLLVAVNKVVAIDYLQLTTYCLQLTTYCRRLLIAADYVLPSTAMRETRPSDKLSVNRQGWQLLDGG